MKLFSILVSGLLVSSQFIVSGGSDSVYYKEFKALKKAPAKKGFFKAFSRKVLMFAGSIVIGQQLLHDLSDEELEAQVAQQIGSIKHNHSNKRFLLQCIALLGTELLLQQSNNMSLVNHRLLRWIAIPGLISCILGKRFANQADSFACEVA